jgi:hypothetical protein
MKRAIAVLVAAWALCGAFLAAEEKPWPQKGDTVYVTEVFTAGMEMRATCKGIPLCEQTHPSCSPIYVSKRRDDRLVLGVWPVVWTSKTRQEWPVLFRTMDACLAAIH